MGRDSDLTPLRGAARFHELAAQARANATGAGTAKP
jgi:hypothetical protein